MHADASSKPAVVKPPAQPETEPAPQGVTCCRECQQEARRAKLLEDAPQAVAGVRDILRGFGAAAVDLPKENQISGWLRMFKGDLEALLDSTEEFCSSAGIDRAKNLPAYLGNALKREAADLPDPDRFIASAARKVVDGRVEWWNLQTGITQYEDEMTAEGVVALEARAYPPREALCERHSGGADAPQMTTANDGTSEASEAPDLTKDPPELTEDHPEHLRHLTSAEGASSAADVLFSHRIGGKFEPLAWDRSTRVAKAARSKGHHHTTAFEFARWCKGHPGLAGLTAHEADSAICWESTPATREQRMDFFAAWNKVKKKHGPSPVLRALRRADDLRRSQPVPLPDDPTLPPFNELHEFISLMVWYQRESPGEPLPVPQKTVGVLLGVDRRTVGRFCKWSCDSGLMTLDAETWSYVKGESKTYRVDLSRFPAIERSTV